MEEGWRREGRREGRGGLGEPVQVCACVRACLMADTYARPRRLGPGCDVKRRRRTRKTQKTLDVDWLVSRTSGETPLRSPWDEHNGSAAICVIAPGGLGVVCHAGAMCISIEGHIYIYIGRCSVWPLLFHLKVDESLRKMVTTVTLGHL